MTLSSSMNASVAGLAANATKLSTISDNIANSATTGYKRVETSFHSMVIGSKAGSYTAGGVRTTATRLVDETGALTTTSNSTDLAVQGRGMIPVMASSDLDIGMREVLLAPTGSFRTDDQGFLVTESGFALLGWPAAQDGTIPSYPRDTGDGLVPVQVGGEPLPGRPTTEVEIALNLPASATQNGATGGAELTSIEYYDNLGMSESLKIEFAPSGTDNQWTMTIRDSASGDGIIGQFTLDFSNARTGGGNLTSVATAGAYAEAWDAATQLITVDVNGGPLTIDIGTLNAPDGVTQLSDEFIPIAVDKNGTKLGNMVSVEVDDGGYVTASYDNGLNVVLYQVPLVDVRNYNALEAISGQAYRVTRDSGEMFLWSAGEGPTGTIAGYAQMESTTDTASELTNLIRTQRAYSSNAKVIQTVDEMLQETTNIKR